jgi:hypothetical protein
MYRLCHWLSVRLRLMAPGDVFHEKAWRTKFTFWGAQLLYTLVTLPLVRLMFNSHAAHTALLLSFLMVTLWNGASFYIEVFSHRYNWQFDETETATIAAPAAPAVRRRGARELDGMAPPSAPLHRCAGAAPLQSDDSEPPAAATAATSAVVPAWLMHVRAAAPVPRTAAAATAAAEGAVRRPSRSPARRGRG